MTQSQIAKIYNNSEVNEDGIMIHNFSFHSGINEQLIKVND